MLGSACPLALGAPIVEKDLMQPSFFFFPQRLYFCTVLCPHLKIVALYIFVNFMAAYNDCEGQFGPSYCMKAGNESLPLGALVQE